MKTGYTFAFLILLLTFYVCVAAEPTRLKASMDGNQVNVEIDGILFTSYKFDSTQKYPYFWPINGPSSGKSVTTETSMPYPHHHSLFFGCDRVNGGNYWQEVIARGQIISSGPQILVPKGTYILFTDQCLWRRPGAKPVFEDKRCFLVHAPDKDTRIIDTTILLKALTDVTIQQTNHALFSARMVPELSVTAGGTLVNAEGEMAEKGTFGQASPWCDYFGTRAGVTEGLAIFQAPTNPWYPCQWFTRDYGFFSPTPMFWLTDGRLEVPREQTITLTYRVIVHNGDVEAAEIDRHFMNYAAIFNNADKGDNLLDSNEKANSIFIQHLLSAGIKTYK
jgi:hypothetical protein